MQKLTSSFIDAFVDDDLTTNLNMKTKDCVTVNSRSKHEATTDQRCQTQGKNLFDSDRDNIHAETKHTSSIPEITHQEFKQEDKANSKEVTPNKKARSFSSKKSTEEKDWTKEGIKTTDKTGREKQNRLKVSIVQKVLREVQTEKFPGTTLINPCLPFPMPHQLTGACQHLEPQ